ncbi:peptidase C14, caspase catalytic subunit p20 [Myxococcus stipitatus DSM 14675]|uniref:Peptidase C14, caspase catalytic subunit p20 n=1 Tax=Myxococcus stipitatus (strain DSM 14675 / JCM 12634 / Mx s8) TaxID=1278073 RepID=L7UGU9_MYXSD|nr:hypothetical protein [Myxococcus stipitatus]AGC45674.1 peptidase C14, caspase catalytic subunit p20 [Myxococcus stipitatus DSM 14675]
MRKTFTTAELTSRLCRPAFRAIEVVARQLGAAVPASTPVEDTLEQGVADEAAGVPARDAAPPSRSSKSAATGVMPTRAEAPSTNPSKRSAALSPIAGKSLPAFAPGAPTRSGTPPQAPQDRGDDSVDSEASAKHAPHPRGVTDPAAAASSDSVALSGGALAPDSPERGPDSIAPQEAPRARIKLDAAPAHRSLEDSAPRSEMNEGLTGSASMPHATESAPTGLSISIKAPTPRPPARQVVRLLRPLAPSAGGSPSVVPGPARSEVPSAAQPLDHHDARALVASERPQGIGDSDGAGSPRTLARADSVPAAAHPDSAQLNARVGSPQSASRPDSAHSGAHVGSSQSTSRPDSAHSGARVGSAQSAPRPDPVHSGARAGSTRFEARPDSPQGAAPAITHSDASPHEPPRDAHSVGSPKPVESMPRPEAPRENTSSPRPVVRLRPPASTPTTTTPPKKRLHFAPPVDDASLPPPHATTQLARQVTQELAPLVTRAEQLSRPPQPPETASRSTPTESAAVRNTFNVNVQVGSDSAANGLDRRTLEDALVDILRETARRHGLEV